MSPNESIKKAIRMSDLKFWQVANEIGYTDSTFSRKLRFELNPETKNLILKAIQKLIKEKSRNE